MKISFAITICNELDEIQNLLPFLLENKNIDDEIVILFDEKNGDEKVLDYILPFNTRPNVQTWRSIEFNNDFASWKNLLNSYCNGDYIFQIDADEMLSKELIINLHSIINSNPETELFYLPRINTVEGITKEHIEKWKWNLNNNGWINFPDFQGRIYKKDLKWEGKVHERITGAKYYSLLPHDNELYCIIHNKTIKRQEKQNKLYSSMVSLNEIYKKYQSPEGHGDKGTAHSYIEEYDRLLTPYRKNSTVLEIGLCMGESLKMWNEFFIDSEVIGVDIDSRYLIDMINENKYNIIIDDATKESFLKHFPDKMFDVIIDDGSHMLQDQLNSFHLLKNKMKSGGIYIIEDVLNIDRVRSTFVDLHDNIEIIDNRHIKNRHDDVLIVYKF